MLSRAIGIIGSGTESYVERGFDQFVLFTCCCAF